HRRSPWLARGYIIGRGATEDRLAAPDRRGALEELALGLARIGAGDGKHEPAFAIEAEHLARERKLPGEDAQLGDGRRCGRELLADLTLDRRERVARARADIGEPAVEQRLKLVTAQRLTVVGDAHGEIAGDRQRR